MYERMLDKHERVTVEEMESYCGNTGKLFKQLNEYLSQACLTVANVRFPYGNGYGWCVTHRLKKQLICDVFAEKDAFTVMLRLKNLQFEKIYKQLQPYSSQIVDGKYPCGDGGWIHYRVNNGEQLEDLITMLLLKCN